MTRAQRGGVLVALLLGAATPAAAYDPVLAARLDAIVQPYANANRFSGAILIARGGDLLFDKAYGMANAAGGTANRPSTSFHVGTLSMQYTAVAVLHLAETHHLALDNTADQFVPGAPHITLQNLLSVAPDTADAMADYELLARVAAAAMQKSFAEVEGAAAFASVWMSGTGIDDGTLSDESRIAKGYAIADGALKPVAADWAALAGAASAYTTTRDELHFLDSFFGDVLVSADARRALASVPAGYGWRHDKRLGADSYWAVSTVPGFSSYVLRQPSTGLTVIVLANLGGAPAEQIGNGLAASVLGRGDDPVVP